MCVCVSVCVFLMRLKINAHLGKGTSTIIDKLTSISVKLVLFKWRFIV